VKFDATICYWLFWRHGEKTAVANSFNYCINGGFAGKSHPSVIAYFTSIFRAAFDRSNRTWRKGLSSALFLILTPFQEVDLEEIPAGLLNSYQELI